MQRAKHELGMNDHAAHPSPIGFDSRPRGRGPSVGQRSSKTRGRDFRGTVHLASMKEGSSTGTPRCSRCWSATFSTIDARCPMPSSAPGSSGKCPALSSRSRLRMRTPAESSRNPGGRHNRVQAGRRAHGGSPAYGSLSLAAQGRCAARQGPVSRPFVALRRPRHRTRATACAAVCRSRARPQAFRTPHRRRKHRGRRTRKDRPSRHPPPLR